MLRGSDNNAQTTMQSYSLDSHAQPTFRMSPVQYYAVDRMIPHC